MSQVCLVNLFPVTHGVNSDLGAHHLIDDPIIPDAELSITFQPSPKRLSISDGIDKKPLLNRFADPFLKIAVDGRKIKFRNIWMVNELIDHKKGSTPHLLVAKGFFGTESPGTSIRFFSPIEVFFKFHGPANQVTGLERTGNTVFLGQTR